MTETQTEQIKNHVQESKQKKQAYSAVRMNSYPNPPSLCKENVDCSSVRKSGRFDQNFQNEVCIQRFILFSSVAFQIDCLTKKLMVLEMFQSTYHLRDHIQPYWWRRERVKIKSDSY